MKTKAKKASTKKAAKATKATKQVAVTKISLAKGVTPEGRRGLMGKMVAALKGHKLTRDELAKRFSKEPRVKVVKNVQWGIRHKVFAEANA